MTCRHCPRSIYVSNRTGVCTVCRRKRKSPDNRVVRLPAAFDVDRERRLEAYAALADERKPIFGGRVG